MMMIGKWKVHYSSATLLHLILVLGVLFLFPTTPVAIPIVAIAHYKVKSTTVHNKYSLDDVCVEKGRISANLIDLGEMTENAKNKFYEISTGSLVQ